MHRKVFRDISIENFISKASFFAYFCTFSDFRIKLPEGMKIQKSLCLHVWSLRMRSNDGMVMKLLSEQRYDPKQVSQSLVWCAEPHKQFFASFKVKQLGTQNTIFGTPPRLPFRIRLPEGMKNCVLSTQLPDFE